MDEKATAVGIRYRVVVPGVPGHKARHRSGKGHYYNPNRKKQDTFLGSAISRKPDKPLSCALRVNVLAVFPRLKKHVKKDGSVKPNAPQYKITKPDKDNIEKFVFDSLNGVFWQDDNIIADGRTVKIYGDEPRTEITIEVIE